MNSSSHSLFSPMLASFCKSLLQINPKYPSLLCILQIHTLKSLSKNEAPLTLNYLINSCGLSPEAALSASKEINLNNTEKPNTVLEFFKTHGFSKAQITNLISFRPHFLLSDVDSTLQPKIKYFHDLGLSDSEITIFISSNPGILLRGLETQIKPSIDFLRNLVQTNENVIKVFRRCRWMFTCNIRKRMLPNIGVLKVYGVPNSRISKMVVMEPIILSANTAFLREVMKRVEELGFERGSGLYVMAIHAMCSMKKSIWEAKIELFKSLGWSHNEIFYAFRKMPLFMKCSEKKIKAGMEFFVNKLRWRPSDVARYPMFLMYSLEGRLIPRSKVWKILKYKELVDEGEVKRMLKLNENDFLRFYVTKYEKEVPYLLKAYGGELEYRWLNDKSNGEDVGNIQKPSF
eukprot:TRINITY_DN4796_c1_g1_i1.p1 TRINITY_DN4796_c1_g1~~TRINITY_DN4796_c1_g1_i1.p1  ORF type:complete len:403 (-),score=64.67 TRINITY_DN4796_c1_g1_i1:610-1818(-)